MAQVAIVLAIALPAIALAFWIARKIWPKEEKS
jgi:hypothetical protein